jgi:hypothetical protein
MEVESVSSRRIRARRGGSAVKFFVPLFLGRSNPHDLRLLFD